MLKGASSAALRSQKGFLSFIYTLPVSGHDLGTRATREHTKGCCSLTLPTSVRRMHAAAPSQSYKNLKGNYWKQFPAVLPSFLFHAELRR